MLHGMEIWNSTHHILSQKNILKKEILEKFKNEGYGVIYHDVGADDEGMFFDRKNPEIFTIDDFIKMKMIKDYQRSFKLILEFIKN